MSEVIRSEIDYWGMIRKMHDREFGLGRKIRVRWPIEINRESTLEEVNGKRKE